MLNAKVYGIMNCVPNSTSVRNRTHPLAKRGDTSMSPQHRP